MARPRPTYHCAVFLLFVITLSSPGFADTPSKIARLADGRQSARPSVAAGPVGEIHVDGRLDEETWRLAPLAGGFSEFEPDRGLPAAEVTTFQVALDKNALYVGISCPGSNIRSVLSRRDKIDDSDYVDVYLDPYGDNTTGYLFRVNPHGVLADATIFADGDTDFDWDTIWQAETRRGQDGWTAEIRIPLSAIRFNSGTPSWGLQIMRYRHASGEQDAWTCWSRDESGFVNRFGSLTGLGSARAPLRLEILPYVVGRIEDPAGPESFRDETETLAKLGCDLRYGLGSNLTVNATFQPDFGQVEVDPAELNLSPYETRFREKRPFFVEGAGFFQHPDFELFYTRRIGLGLENARIRGATKLLGKLPTGTSLGFLVAATDVTADGQSHNLLKSGSNRRYHAVGRVGQDLANGAHSFHLMGTATGLKTFSRPEALTGGLDFDLNFNDRAWNLSGSLVGSGILGDNNSTEWINGCGATLSMAEVAGAWQGGLTGRLEDNALDLNHMGYLRDPNKIEHGAWLMHNYHAGRAEASISQVMTRLDIMKSWIAGGRTVRDHADRADILWSYGPGHPREFWFELASRMRHRNFWSADLSLYYGLENTQTSVSRATPEYGAGPLVRSPAEYGFSSGLSSDPRSPLSASVSFNLYAGDQENRDAFLIGGLNWIQSPRLNHHLTFSFIDSRHVRQHVMNTAYSAGEGIGGIHYVFAELRRDIWDMTLRSNLLFGRNTSLELYLQPYLTKGNYRDAKELVDPDSENFQVWSADGFDIDDRDFFVGAVNLKAVFRWEYRPGSTLFLAWTHSRFSYENQLMFGSDRIAEESLREGAWGAWFDEEPENILLAKLTWWFAD